MKVNSCRTLRLLKRTMRGLFTFILFLWLIPALGGVWAPDSVQARDKYLRDKTIVPVPVVFRLPETGFGGGAVVTSTFSFARDSASAKPSQLSFGVTFTQKKQILIFCPFSIFYDNNRYYFNGETGWYKYNYYYFGIGENRVPAERFDVTYPRIRVLAARKVSRNIYLGARYHYESFNLTATEPGGELASGRIAGSDFSQSAGLGISILRDTRDTVFYPRRGVFAEAYVLPHARLFGGDRPFTRLNLDLAHYQSLTKKLVLATHYVVSSVIGNNVPFNQLPNLGGPKRMRGVLEGFFRDKNSFLTQAELRWEAWGKIGFVGFGSLAYLGGENDFLRLNKPKYTYGLGLRVLAQKKNHLNLRLDYGLSPYGAGNFYATIGEAF